MEPLSYGLAIAVVGFVAFAFGCFTGAFGSRASGQSGTPGLSTGGTRPQDSRRLEAKIDVLLRHFDLTSEVDAEINKIAQQHGVPQEVMALLPNHKIEAIKLLRSLKGIGLKEAKEQVDAACAQMRY